ncbi:hypothetical protein BC834DRAFT_897604 [Gloeopeniophorella convolvens]|nr:hypothetical protein BC834DRAFT_897604 [Gloeopeniophorella convolvens]
MDGERFQVLPAAEQHTTTRQAQTYGRAVVCSRPADDLRHNIPDPIFMPAPESSMGTGAAIGARGMYADPNLAGESSGDATARGDPGGPSSSSTHVGLSGGLAPDPSRDKMHPDVVARTQEVAVAAPPPVHEAQSWRGYARAATRRRSATVIGGELAARAQPWEQTGGQKEERALRQDQKARVRAQARLQVQVQVQVQVQGEMIRPVHPPSFSNTASSAALHREELPTGLPAVLMQCYSPSCSETSPCYWPACPRQDRVRATLDTLVPEEPAGDSERTAQLDVEEKIGHPAQRSNVAADPSRSTVYPHPGSEPPSAQQQISLQALKQMFVGHPRGMKSNGGKSPGEEHGTLLKNDLPGSGDPRDDVEGPPESTTPSKAPSTSYPDSLQRTSKKVPKHLDSTLSSWLRNMARLSLLIDRLHDLASNAQPHHRRQLDEQVDALRASFDTQQKRYTEFLKLTEEYASRYLDDISGAIEQQRAFLDVLEERLDKATELRGKVVTLRTAYESRMVKAVMEIRTKALAEPLPKDADLFDEVDCVLDEIRRCFVEMDKFWVEEVRRVSKALQDCRRVDEEYLRRWQAFRTSLEQTIASWTNTPSQADDSLQGRLPLDRASGAPTASTASSTSPAQRDRAEPMQATDVGAIAMSLSPALRGMRSALQRVNASASATLIKPAQQPLIVRAHFEFVRHADSCLDFLRECSAYAEKIVATYGPPTVLLAPVPRAKTFQDLQEDFEYLGSKFDTSHLRAEDARYSMHDRAKTRKFASIHAQSLALLCKIDNTLGTLLEHVASWKVVLDALDSAPFEPTLMQLRKTSRVWLKRRRLLREMLVAAEGGRLGAGTRGNLATRLGSMVTRGMRALVSFSS